MDDRRFDSLVRALAEGKSRRSVLKGLLGLGGAALVGTVALDGDSEAARRPTNPTPTPVKCPGIQTSNGTTCVCPATAPNKCGPDCCTGKTTDPFPRLPSHSECCDNACCFGTCYGEELCCPTNSGSGEQPPTHKICDTTTGPQCCPVTDQCCIVDGCCPTVCFGGSVGADFCCSQDHFCPGGSDSADVCCAAGQTCCGGGTNDNRCADFSTGGCCATSDCPPPGPGECNVECVAGQCTPVTCTGGNICCQGECVTSSVYVRCPADPDECCNTSLEVCCGAGGCCVEEVCNPGAGVCCTADQTPCGSGDNTCCDSPETCCGGTTCCAPGSCTTAGECCSGGNIFCANDCCPAERCTPGVGCCSEGFLACSGGICCKADVYQCSTTGPGCECLPGTEACGLLPGGCCPTGQCNTDSGDCCEAGTEPCGLGCCPTGQCNGDGDCCVSGTTPCGGVCCDDATQSCSANGTCVCTAQCCGTDTSTCEALGFDAECVTCDHGNCSDGGTDFNPCAVGDDAEGFCNQGVCEPCLSEGAACTQNQECCNNQGYFCTGGFCTS